jgi:hypothetical protein
MYLKIPFFKLSIRAFCLLRIYILKKFAFENLIIFKDTFILAGYPAMFSIQYRYPASQIQYPVGYRM